MNRIAALKARILREQAPLLARLRHVPDSGFIKHFDREGARISNIEWMVLFRYDEYRNVTRTRLARHAFVSTVWLGQDLGGIFETMVLPDYERQARYATEAEAWAGHERITHFLLDKKRANPKEFAAAARRAYVARQREEP